MYDGRGGEVARLTDKQKRFVEEYLVDLNATQAAVRAGYSEKTAGQIGEQNLKKLEVQAALQEAMADRSARTEITQDMVLRELAAIGFSNAVDYVQIDQNGMVKLTPTGSLTQEQQRVIAGIKDGKYGVELKLYDKLSALELLGRHLGLFDGKGAQKHTGENNLLSAIRDTEEIDTDDLPEAE